jgi:hypothetical protein
MRAPTTRLRTISTLTTIRDAARAEGNECDTLFAVI